MGCEKLWFVRRLGVGIIYVFWDFGWLYWCLSLWVDVGWLFGFGCLCILGVWVVLVGSMVGLFCLIWGVTSCFDLGCLMCLWVLYVWVLNFDFW